MRIWKNTPHLVLRFNIHYYHQEKNQIQEFHLESIRQILTINMTYIQENVQIDHQLLKELTLLSPKNQ